jgi:hypothetical protein
VIEFFYFISFLLPRLPLPLILSSHENRRTRIDISVKKYIPFFIEHPMKV